MEKMGVYLGVLRLDDVDEDFSGGVDDVEESFMMASSSLEMVTKPLLW